MSFVGVLDDAVVREFTLALFAPAIVFLGAEIAIAIRGIASYGYDHNNNSATQRTQDMSLAVFCQ